MKIKKVLLLVLFLNILLIAKPTEEGVTKLYVATFNRAPDQLGLEYWINDSGLTLKEIAKSFFVQDETKEKYPEGTTNKFFIQTVYKNLFNRDVDEDGLKYWEKELSSGLITKDIFLMAVINGAKNNNDGNDKTTIDNKTKVGSYFVHSKLNNKDQAIRVISDVTDNTYTVDYSKGIIDIYKGNIKFSEDLEESKVENKNLTVFDIDDKEKIVIELYSDKTAMIKNNSGTKKARWRIRAEVISITYIDNSFLYDIQIEDDLDIGDIVRINGRNYVAESIADVLYDTNYEKYNISIVSNALANDAESIILGDRYGQIYKYLINTKKIIKLFNVNYYINSIELVNDIIYIGSMTENSINKYTYPEGEFIETIENIFFPDGLGAKNSILYSVSNDKDGILKLIDIKSQKRYYLNTTVPDPVGIANYNNKLYILDESGDIYKYDFDNTNVSKIFTNTKFNTTSNENATGLEGITILNDKIWVSFINDGNLYKLNLDL